MSHQPQSNGANRVPIWELHIRPLFRLLDREHMSWLDLWKYKTVLDHRGDILKRLKSTNTPMPTFDSGGPWPQEWIDLFQRWITTGSRRLELAVPDANGYQLEQTFSGWRISGRVDTPGTGFRVWLDIERVGHLEREYRLVLEPPAEHEPSDPISMAFQDTFKRKDVERLLIHDRNGLQELEFPAGK